MRAVRRSSVRAPCAQTGGAVDTMSDVALELLSVTFTQAPLGLRLDAYGFLAAVLDTAEESTQRLRPCDELVGINGTLYDDVPTDSTPDAAAELCDLVGEYVEAGAFPLTLTFRRDPSLMCQPVGACFERRSIAPSRRSSSGGQRRRRTWRSSRSPKRRRTLAASPSPIYASQTSSSSLSTIHPPGNAPLFSSMEEDAPASPGAAPAFALPENDAPAFAPPPDEASPAFPPPNDDAASTKYAAAEPVENDAAPTLMSPDAAEPAGAAPVDTTTTITRHDATPKCRTRPRAAGPRDRPRRRPPLRSHLPRLRHLPPRRRPRPCHPSRCPRAPRPRLRQFTRAPRRLRLRQARQPRRPRARHRSPRAPQPPRPRARRSSQRSSSSRSCPVARARSFLPSTRQAASSTRSPSPRPRTRACPRCSRSPRTPSAPARWRCWTNCDAITASRRSLSACGRDAAATSASLGRRAKRSDSRVTEPSSPSSGTTRRSSLEAKCGRRPLRWAPRRPHRAHSPRRRRPPRRRRRRPHRRRSCRQ